jgi:subfamily B ATP-binding cassette protein MsbA
MKKTNNFSMYDCLFIALYTMFFIHKIIPNLLEGYINSNSQLFQILQHHSQRNEGDLINSITVGKIEMKNISFSYPGSNQKILNQMSMSIPSDYVSKVIALVGLNGCGKSTVLQLLNKQHQIGNGGSILIDDIDIKNYTSSAICGSIFLIPHCKSTIEEYIGEIVQLDVSKISEELKNEIETINCLIDNPLLKTALALALIMTPKIVLIDEATNDLTSEQEEVVLNFITSFRPTCIIATHKPSTIRRADYILVMSDGKIKEQGKHEELVALKGLYYAIVTH